MLIIFPFSYFPGILPRDRTRNPGAAAGPFFFKMLVRRGEAPHEHPMNCLMFN